MSASVAMSNDTICRTFFSASVCQSDSSPAYSFADRIFYQFIVIQETLFYSDNYYMYVLVL